MTATWVAARDALAVIIGAVEITDPIPTRIKRIYPYRVGTETDFPCIVMPNPPGKKVERGPSGYRSRAYDILLQLMVKDANTERAAEIIDSFEEAIIDAIDGAVTLGLFAGYHITAGPNWEAAGTVALENSTTAHMASGIITLKMTDGKNYVG